MRCQRLAPAGEGVLDAERAVADDATLDHALGFEVVEAVREDGPGYVRDGPFEGRETERAAVE